MTYANAWKSGTAVLVALGLTTATVAPMVMPLPVSAQSRFPDVPSSYWASEFIQALVSRNIIAGFPEDGTFRPEEPVTRAQFAAMLSKAFSRSPIRNPIQFADVPSGYWGAAAIQSAYTTGFMAGYPGNAFRPNENIPRAQVLVSLTSGLQYASTNPVDATLAIFSDTATIPSYARPGVAAATERRMVVNYPDVKVLNPNQVATRAEVAALIYQALVSTGQVAAISSPYVVGQQVSQALKIPAGTPIPVRYERAEKILLARNEPQPAPLTLTVARNIVTADGQVLIPAGSTVNGELRTANGAAQFFAKELILSSGEKLSLDATSEPITKVETIRKGASAGKIIAGTVVGAGAAAGIAGVTGDRTIEAWEVLTGAGVGAIASVAFGGERIDLIAIDPNTDLTLTLGTDLVLRP